MTYLLDAWCYGMNSANPLDREALLAEQERLEMRLQHVTHQLGSEGFTHGYARRSNIEKRRETYDAQLNELHRILHEHDFSGLDRCIVNGCQNYAGKRFRFMGRCEPCFIAATTGQAPTHIDPTALPAPAINR